MRLTDFEKKALIKIDYAKWNQLTRFETTSLNRKGFIDVAEDKTYEGLTNLGVLAIEHMRYQNERDHVLRMNTEDLIHQLETAYQHSYAIDYDMINDEPKEARDIMRCDLLAKRFPNIPIY